MCCCSSHSGGWSVADITAESSILDRADVDSCHREPAPPDEVQIASSRATHEIFAAEGRSFLLYNSFPLFRARLGEIFRQILTGRGPGHLFGMLPRTNMAIWQKLPKS
jgi:hypothetical protein